MSDPVVPQNNNSADSGAPSSAADSAPVASTAGTHEAVFAPVEVPGASGVDNSAPAAPALPAVPDTVSVPESAEPVAVSAPETPSVPAEAPAAPGLEPVTEVTAVRDAEPTGTFVGTGTTPAYTYGAPEVAGDAAATGVLTGGIGGAEYDAAPPADQLPATVAIAPAAVAAAPQFAPQPPLSPVFVQAPEPPRERGNRGLVFLVALIATASFAVLMYLTYFVMALFSSTVSLSEIGLFSLGFLQYWGVWVTVAIFFLAFWILGVIINRGRWGLWVHLSLVVSLITWVGMGLGAVIASPFWLITLSDGQALSYMMMFSPTGVAALIFSRELTVWFGAWIARSGAKKRALNEQDYREYEKSLEAGPNVSV